MAWYSAGTISVTNGSDIVEGVDTLFSTNAKIGDILWLQDTGETELYEVTAVLSSGRIKLHKPYSGTTRYRIGYTLIRGMTNATNYDLMKKIEEFLSDRQTNLNEFRDWLNGTETGGPNGDGTYPLTDRFGTTTYEKSPARLQWEYEQSSQQALEDAATAASIAEGLGDFADAKAAAEQAASDAQESASDASDSATDAADSAQEAKDSAQSAAQSQAEADQKAIEAANSAQVAKNSEEQAAANASAASSSASDAADTLAAVQDLADQVSADKGQTKTYRDEASDFATRAADSESAAKASEQSASQSKTNAANSASAAANSASQAASKAAEADLSAQQAASSAQRASTSASQAESSAESAAEALAAAERIEEQVALDRGIVESSKESASEYASQAASSATAADASKRAASESESKAANSASEAEEAKAAAYLAKSAAEAAKDLAEEHRSAAQAAKGSAQTSAANAGSAAADAMAAANEAVEAASRAVGASLRMGPWDASGGLLPPTPSENVTYMVNHGGTLPGIGYVAEGDELFYDVGLGDWYAVRPSTNYVRVDGGAMSDDLAFEAGVGIVGRDSNGVGRYIARLNEPGNAVWLGNLSMPLAINSSTVPQWNNDGTYYNLIHSGGGQKITGTLEAEGFVLAKDKVLRSRRADGTAETVLKRKTDDGIEVGDGETDLFLMSADVPRWWNGSTTRQLLHSGGGQTIAGTLKVNDTLRASNNAYIYGSRLLKYIYLRDYDDGESAQTGIRSYVRNGTWYLHKNDAETNPLKISVDGKDVLTTGGGQTIGGKLTITDTLSLIKNGGANNLAIGDDIILGDGNKANTLFVRGAQNNTSGYIIFGNQNGWRRLGSVNNGPLMWGDEEVLTTAGNQTIKSTLTVASRAIIKSSFPVLLMHDTDKTDQVVRACIGDEHFTLQIIKDDYTSWKRNLFSLTLDAQQLALTSSGGTIGGKEILTRNSDGRFDGPLRTNGRLVAGDGSGSVALTVNDGYGNANITFNHEAGKPDYTGNAGRITVNTDSSTNASMIFALKSGVTKDTSVSTNGIFYLYEDHAKVVGDLYVTDDIHEAGTKLSDKYLGKTATAANASKVNNISSSQIVYGSGNTATNAVTDWDDLGKSGFYDGSNIPNDPSGNAEGWYWGVHVSHRHNTNYGWTLVSENSTNPNWYLRGKASGNWGNWHRVLHEDITARPTSTWYFQNNITLENSKWVHGRDTGGSYRSILGVTNSDEVEAGHPDLPFKINSSSVPKWGSTALLHTGGGQTITSPTLIKGTHDKDDTGASHLATGLYVADLGSQQGASGNPTYTAAIVGSLSKSRQIALSVDSDGRVWGKRVHSTSGTYVWASRVKEADNADKLDGKQASEFASSSHTHSWSSITGKPSSFTPSSHTHSWSSITGKPSSFTPSSHTHSEYVKHGEDNVVIGGIKFFRNDGYGNMGLRFNSNTGALAAEDGISWEIDVANDSAQGSFVIGYQSSVTAGQQATSHTPALTIKGSDGSVVINSGTLYVGGAKLTDAGSSDAIKVTSGSGYLIAGPTNTSYCHFETDRGKFYFNKPIHVNGGLYLYGKESTNYWNSSGELAVTRLRISSNTDASLTSTGHGLQIGGTNATNLILDNNEIIARNNGSYSPLYLDGSKVRLNYNGSFKFETTSSGSTTNGQHAATTFNATSARKYKTDIAELDFDVIGLLDKKEFEPRQYKWREDYEGRVEGVHYGFIADEVAKEEPHEGSLVKRGSDGDVESMNYINLIAILWKQNQIQEKRIRALEARG